MPWVAVAVYGGKSLEDFTALSLIAIFPTVIPLNITTVQCKSESTFMYNFKGSVTSS